MDTILWQCNPMEWLFTAASHGGSVYFTLFLAYLKETEMPQSIFDFEALGKRVKELGIQPIYHTEEEQPAQPPVAPVTVPKPGDVGMCDYCQKNQKVCDGSCWC